MSYLTIAIYRPSEWHSFSGSTAYVFADDTTITFTVTLTNPLRSDGNAPQVMSQPAPTGTNTSHLGAGNRGNYFDANAALAGNINAVTQSSIWDGATISLDGVAVRKDGGGAIDGHKYAKSVTINLQDLGQNGVAASGTQATYYAGLAGLSFNGGAQTPTVYDGGQNTGNIGYGEGYYVWKVDAARDKGVLTLYFNDNVSNLKVRVYDSGNSYLEITVNVDGIKTGGDNMNSRGVSVTAGEYMTDDNNGKWLWNSDYDLSPSFTSAGAGAYAQVWFYAVKRYDSLAEANDTAIGVTTTGSTTSWQPIGYSTNDSGFRTVGRLEFDISTGMLSGIPAVNGDDDGGNGSGYYRFEFYNMNYAGYVSSTPVVRVVKVDIDTPDPTTTLKYDKTKNPLVAGTLNDGEIDSGMMAYVSTDLTVTVTLNKVNFSGNKVSVLGADGNVYIFLVGYDEGITGIYTESEDGSLTDASSKWSDNTQTGDVFATVKVTSKKTEEGGLTFTVVYTAPADTLTEKQHNFVVYNNADELESALTGCLNGTDTAWNGVGGTRLWFDHIGINDVTFKDEYAGETTYADETTGVIPAGDARNWFTSEWAYGGDLAISTTDEYQYIFYKLAYYTEDFGNAEGTSGDYAAVKGEFDSNAYFGMMGEEVMATGGWTLLDSGVTSIDFTNITEKQAGYYVVYVITADRASHFDFTAFGVLVDATDYVIRAEYDAKTLEVLGNIDPFGLNEIGEQTLKRGGLYTFNPELKDEYKVADTGAHMYVPYQVKKAVLEASGYNYVYIYSHAANDTTGTFKEESLRAGYLYASIAAGGGLDLDVDRNSVTQLPAANGQTAIVFSFRQVVNVSFDNAAQYTGEHIDIQVNAYDLNGGQVTIAEGNDIAEGNEPYVLKYQGTGTYEGVTNAGSYEFLLDYKSTDFDIDSYLKHSQYYVLAKVATVTLNVSKVDLSLNATLNPGTLYYGEVTGDNAVEKLGLSYGITGGLVGQDAGHGFDDLTGANVAAVVVGASSGVYLDAGSHNVTVAFSTTNYNVSVEWTTDQVMQIAKRELAFTVDSPAEVIYGNAMPSSYTVRMDKSVFNFDTLRKYQTAEDVGKMLGVTVTEEGEQWVFSFNADAFAAFTPGVKEGYYNVGDYAITGFDVEKTSVNNNFAPTQTGESKVTVVARVVTVSPQLPGVVNVESLDELAGLTFPIATEGNPDVTAFGISGNFVVGEQESVVAPGTEYTYAITGDVSTFKSDHNTADVTNVKIVFGDTSAWTFKVHIITAAGQFVIEFTDAGIFTVTYGELFNAAAIAANADDSYYTVEYYTKDTDGNYTVKEEALPDGVTLVVTITAAGYQADLYANHAGNYNLTVSAEAQGAAEGVFYTYAYKTADGALPAYVTVETLQATVNVSEVTPLSKEYGKNDPIIDPAAFGFAFTSEAHQELLDTFIENNGGEIFVSGIGTTWNRTASVGSYDYNWSNCTFYTSAGDIASGDIRFEIAGIEDVKFEIKPKVLDFNALVVSGGILVTAAGKGYDGDTTAEGASLSFASGDTIVVAGEVALGYDANYWDGTGYVAEVGSGYAVRFANIVLTGTGVNNYTLVIADEEEGYGFFFDYEGTDGKGFGISPEAVTFLTNFFSVSKTFDGGTGMEQGNIAFNPGTGFEAFRNGWSLVEGKFDSANAGTGILVTFTILCPKVVYPNLTVSGYPLEAYYIMPEGLTLTPVNGEGKEGVYIEVTGNVTGEIGQFTLSSAHINFKFEPADRTKVYDGNGVFEVPFEFNDTIKGLLVEGFDFGSIGLEFAGKTGKNVGDHAMKITGVSITKDKTNFRLGETLDGNDVGEGGTETGYATIEGMINGTTGGKPFSITPKKLTFDVAFEGVNVYAGLETLSATTPATIYGVIDGEELKITASTYTYARAAAEGGYKTFVYVQAERFDEASGNYYHDVLITITVSTGNEFDWNNYTLEGLNKVEGKDNEFTVFREGAAILNPRGVEINLSEVKVSAKTYDATNAVPAGNIVFSNAFTTGAAAGTTATDAFIGKDFDNLVFSYTATYDSANAGTNRKVNISGLTLTAKEGFDHVALSYNITSQVSTTVNGIINPVEVEVSFRLPDKVYDGTGFGGIGVNGIYPLGARESAADLEVRLSAPANSGRTNWYVDGETAYANYQMRVRAVYYSSTDASETAQGFVLGYELILTSGGNASPAVNYVIKGASSDTVEYAVFALTADELTEEAAKLITAQYASGGETLYLVKASDIPEEGIAGLEERERVALNSFEATGVINPAEVSFSVTILDSGAFKKEFDDTAGFKIVPEYGTDYTVEVPGGFFDSSELSGNNFTVTFDSAAVGVRDVIFRVSGTSLGGNFVFNGKDNSFVAEGEGRIDKTSITVSLYTADGGQNEAIQAVYGAEAFGYQLNYTLNGKPLTVDADGNAYLTTDDWLAAFGHDSLPEEVNGRRYALNEGEYVLDAEGTYVRLTGKIGAAALTTADGKAFVGDKDLVSIAAGTYNDVKVTVAADSFNVNKATQGNVTQVIVSPAEIKVTVTPSGGNGFTTQYYIGKLPGATFAWFDKDATGVTVDDAAAVLKSIRASFVDAEGSVITDTDLDITDVYTLDADVTGSYVGNYKVVVVGADGNETTHTLTVTVPALDETWFSLKTVLKKTYSLDAESKPVALTVNDVLGGIRQGDVVTITWYKDSVKLESAPSAAGEYEFVITVKRPVGGTHGYFYGHGGNDTYSQSGVFEITKRDVNIAFIERPSFVYDGQAHQIDPALALKATDKQNNQIIEGFINVLSVMYNLNGESMENMVNAGTYVLEITVGAEYAANYNVTENTLKITVAAAPVTVSVTEASKTQDVTGGATEPVTIDFSVQGFATSDFKVVYRDNKGRVVDSVTTPGVYTYTILPLNSNYTVRDGGTGSLTVTISEVSFVKEDVSYVTVKFPAPVTVDYTVTDTAVASGSNYWKTVDGNVQALAGEDEILTTDGILRIEVKGANGIVTNIPGGVEITARIPDTVGSSYSVYRVTEDGKLALMEAGTDYTVSGNTITYTTEYISNLVFVGTGTPGFDWWILLLAAAALVLVFALAVLIAVLVKLHRAPDSVPVEVAPIDSIMPAPAPAPAPAAPAPVIIPAADIAPVTYDAPAAVSKHKQPPIIGIR